jgi:cobalt-zinc-cadmium efflux system outer membrane protein
VRDARESLRLAEQAEDRAHWAWFPTVELGGGLKRAHSFGTDSGYGYALGVSLRLPLFDHGQAERGQAEAQRALARARSDALTRSIDAEMQTALVTFRTAREEFSRFEAQTSSQVEMLLAAAQSGYREGERTIVELLDAQRAQADVAERRLGLLAMAKRAEVRLRAATGDFQ